jgi:hypothetical protein
MRGHLWKRLEAVEHRFGPRRGRRVILASQPVRDEPRETHDSIRARLGLKASPTIIDLVFYCLPPGSPPRLDEVQEWGCTVEKAPEVAAAT